jgi:hypothetical protein
MERPVHETPSVAWATSRDLPGVLGEGPQLDESRWRAHPAGRRVRGALSGALAELQPAAKLLAVRIIGPDEVQLKQGEAWLDRRGVTAADIAREFGGSVADEDLPGWVTPWTVIASGGSAGAVTLLVLPTQTFAELGAEIAEWLQDVLADMGYSEAVPQCPGHSHPMRPIVDKDTAWWSCPQRGPVRPWNTQPGPEVPDEGASEP